MQWNGARPCFEDDIADKWHQERLLLTRKIPEVWCDYGAFLSRRGMFGKAEEAGPKTILPVSQLTGLTLVPS